ncbi:unnamed protein product [Oppiella nova]|uniref:Uncharacterized protein n=1 Tax=Oppiella nova TaxID=334625 RepID=A0A7R9LB56_9ACAR|nr:unnamed protein product [Oppiella nova]CAG2161788.1 unnamed protein product [Oppiella nova]
MIRASLSLQLITISIITLQRQLQHLNSSSRKSWDTNYDYIVVGAGAAGAVVAGRLSQNANIRVLLLEAGGPETVITDIPANYFSITGNPEFDWNYPIADQPNIARAYNRPIHMSVGKVLGGSSTLSGMVYNRGNRNHFDEWHSRYGCLGWNYDNILQYFLRAENNTDSTYLMKNSKYHSNSGVMTVSSDWGHLNALPIFKTFIETAAMAGYPTIDVNGPTQLGSTLFQHQIRDGIKVTTSSAYLTPNLNRNNLHIVTQAMVTKILFSGLNARGIQFTRNGVQYSVDATREVILSAGAIGSAKLLMLSGIGPKNHLNSFNIPVLSDLPVGNNFHDHTSVVLNFDILDQSQSYELVELTVQNLYEYYINSAGALTMFPNAATYQVTQVNNQKDWPDIMTEMTRSNNLWYNLSDITRQYGSHVKEWEDYWRPYVGRRLLLMYNQMVRPRARGTVRLASRDPNVDPIVDPNYLGDPYDMDSTVNGIRNMITRISTVGPFAAQTRRITTTVPGCRKCGYDDECDEYLRCLVRQTAQAVYRHVGTCRCGSAADSKAVVDERLRVINVKRLRVVDASIMPQGVNSNHLPAAVMIAEYGSQMIQDDMA